MHFLSSNLCIHLFTYPDEPSEPAKEGKPHETISGKTAGMEEFPGYFKFYRDDEKGKIWL